MTSTSRWNSSCPATRRVRAWLTGPPRGRGSVRRDPRSRGTGRSSRTRARGARRRRAPRRRPRRGRRVSRSPLTTYGTFSLSSAARDLRRGLADQVRAEHAALAGGPRERVERRALAGAAQDQRGSARRRSARARPPRGSSPSSRSRSGRRRPRRPARAGAARRRTCGAPRRSPRPGMPAARAAAAAAAAFSRLCVPGRRGSAGSSSSGPNSTRRPAPGTAGNPRGTTATSSAVWFSKSRSLAAV